MLKNWLFVLVKINSYMPLVLLPICAYKALKNVFFAGITIVLWRLLTYYKYTALNFILHNFIAKIMLLSLLATVSMLYMDIYLKTIIVLLLSSVIPLYFALDKVTIQTNKSMNFFLIISGMVIAGLLITRATFLNYYFITVSALLLFVGKSSNFNKNKLSFTKLYICDVLNVFAHNLHYYLFAFSIPLIAYRYSGNYYMSGITCSLSWVLFLPKDYFIDRLMKFLDLRKILGVGFLITAALLIIIGFSTDIFVVCICLLFQGASAGISEGFWGIETIKNSPSQYWGIWKLGGILGALLGSLIAFYTGIEILFILASVLALAGGVMNFCISMFQKTNSGGFKIGY